MNVVILAFKSDSIHQAHKISVQMIDSWSDT